MFPSVRHNPLIRWAIALSALHAAAMPAHAQDAEDRSGPDDRLEEFLLDRGMLELLVQQLEQRIDTATDTRERTEVAERLAGVYARLLSEAGSVEEQRRWESAGERLLQQVPDANTIELRLGLARASYTRIEQVAERYVLRMLGEAERVDAVARMSDLRGRFAAIGMEADRRVRELEREEERGARIETEWLAEALAQARRQRSMAFYLAGWSAFHVAEMGRDPAAATEAIKHFGWLLGAERLSEPRLDDVSEASLRYEHIARAALATAAAHAIRGNIATAEQWIDAIESTEGLSPGVRDQIFTRRFILESSSGDWSSASGVVTERRGTPPLRSESESDEYGDPLPVGLARLVAVYCFEEIRRNPDTAYMPWQVERLRDLALGDLMVQDQLGHVLDLARRYSSDRFGDESFISLHIRGLMLYQEARDSHTSGGSGTDEPTGDPDIAKLYREAAELFVHSLRTPDASRFVQAHANTRMLIGLSIFYAGEHSDAERGIGLDAAADALVLASSEFTDRERAADALWMAIRSLDQRLKAAEEDLERAVRARRDELIARFLREYPENQKSAALVLRLAESSTIPTQQRIELLMSVPEGNPLRVTSLRTAAMLAYEMYQNAKGDERDAHAARFLEIAEPLLMSEQRSAFAGDERSQRYAVARARQVAEASLSMRVPDLVRAERAIALLEKMLIEGVAGASDVESEIRFRRAQLALASGRQGEAERIIRELSESGSDLGESSVRLFYRDVVIEFERVDRPGTEASRIVEVGRRLVRVGQDMLDQIASDDASMTQQQRELLISVRNRVGTAAKRVWEIESDKSALSIAFAQFRAALSLDPKNADALRGVAELGGPAGDDLASLEAWRTLVSGYRAGSEAWFEARTGHLVALARVDRERALTVLRQHAVLYPDLGPEPHATRLRELARELGMDLPGEGGAGG